ncbi:MAG: glycoside hydrolase family 3 C-terminal domain-containing protein [Dehalococcoidales bacterium]|nr:glycoside hydrolase family 3 C-terminal domain-containing protein [Dehalococcoidales bacterium]
MTLEEKVSMLAGTDAWHTRSIDRLGIPSLKMTDGPYGTRTESDHEPGHVIPATCYPTGSAMGATWNTDLIERVGVALGEETKSMGCHILLGPCVNIHRSPLGGRNFESFSEDPYLAARMAVAHISGVQSRNIGTSIKHFALNNSEFERFSMSSEASERAIREIYFPAFEMAVREAQPWTVMSSYNRINGVAASENRWLLTEVLKDEWGFEGFVVSDWGGVYNLVPAANSGLDMEMPGPARFFGEALVAAVRQGEVSQETIDGMVRRVLRVVVRSGAFEETRTSSPEAADTPEHRALARETASEAIVLLKNDQELLPLKLEQLTSIAVIGPNATEARVVGAGSSQVTPRYTVTPLEGITRACGDSVEVVHEPGCRIDRFTSLLDARCLGPSGGEGQGLTGEYFNNNDLSGDPVLTRVDSRFALRWRSGVFPVPGIDRDDFSIRWTGTFLAPESGDYWFGVLTDGFGRIYIDGRLVVEKRFGEAEEDLFLRGERTGTITMEAGRFYDLKIEYWWNPERAWPFRRIRLGCEPPFPENAVARAAGLAARSDVAVVFVGTSEEYDREGNDRESMDLPGAQVELIEAVARANRHTVVVLNNGNAVAIAEWLDRVPAVLEAWFAGQECGNAIADVLFGDVNPSGKLPETVPRRIEDNPAFINYPGENGRVLYGEGIFVGYRYYDAKKIEPLFPFGHGLSYTTFEYGRLTIPAEVAVGDDLTVRIDITNTGEREGKEVVQLYIHDIESSLVRPHKELKGFTKVSLTPGETRTVSFTLGQRDLSFYDPDRQEWVAEPGEFEVLVGSSSRDIRATGSFTLKP